MHASLLHCQNDAELLVVHLLKALILYAMRYATFSNAFTLNDSFRFVL